MKRIYVSPPHMGRAERSLLLDAFDSNWIAPMGPHLERFERELASKVGVEDAVAVSSGTAALHLALVLLGVGEGDEVIAPTLTFAATLNAIRYVGGVPVLIDSNRETWTIDPGLVIEELEDCAQRGKLPKALIAVDLYGQCSDYDPIVKACSRYGVPVVADACESLGATYHQRAAGSQGSMGVFSFNGNKIITTGGGGMLVSDRKDWIERARHLICPLHISRPDVFVATHRAVGRERQSPRRARTPSRVDSYGWCRRPRTAPQQLARSNRPPGPRARFRCPGFESGRPDPSVGHRSRPGSGARVHAPPARQRVRRRGAADRRPAHRGRTTQGQPPGLCPD